MSVYCSYCGNRGHNKLGCPSRKKYARENPDSWLAREVKYEEQKRAERVASRTCTYCDKPGHNRRGCQTLQEDINRVSYRQREYQDQFLREAESAGLSVGALVEIDHTSSFSEGNWLQSSLTMITEFCWDDISFLAKDLKESSTGHTRFDRQPVFRGKVLNLTGIPKDEEYRFPKLNDVFNLNLGPIAHLLPSDLFNDNIKNILTGESSRYMEGLRTVRVISPVHGDGAQEEYLRRNGRVLPETVQRTFHFVHKTNERDRYFKQRVPFAADLWKNVYPDTWKPHE